MMLVNISLPQHLIIKSRWSIW